MQYQALEKGIEVNGRTIYSIVDGFKLIKSVPVKLLSARGIGEKSSDGKYHIKANEWYSQQSWLDAFKDIAQEVGDAILYQIGQKIPENAEFPDWIKTIHDAIKSIDIAYHMNHRKNGTVMFNPQTGIMIEGIGHYKYVPVEGKDQIQCICNNPYPCDFDMGIIVAMAKKFEKNSSVFHAKGECRKTGGVNCTYNIMW